MNPYTEIRLPDTMTRAEAERILAEHIAWVPMEHQDVPAGARVRQEFRWRSGCPTVLVHPDDVPTDPDAELIEKMAQALRAALAAVRDHEAQR